MFSSSTGLSCEALYVATRRKDDRKELYQACGTKEYRKKLDEQFKNVLFYRLQHIIFNTNIIHYQPFIFPVKNSVDTGNRLNQRMLLQWLINIHDCQSRACQSDCFR